jgi:hypothetical protein
VKRPHRKLTYANVASTLALFVALGGSAFAATHLAKNSVGTAQLKANAVTGAKVRDGSLTGADVNASSLGTVPAAQTAEKATTAATATLAEKVAAPEAPHLVGEPGEPTFAAGWEDFLSSTLEGAAFYKDREGIVHLQGRIVRVSGTSSFPFVLPAGFAPAEPETFPVLVGNATDRLTVFADGSVGLSTLPNSQSVFLEGVSWRAGR